MNRDTPQRDKLRTGESGNQWMAYSGMAAAFLAVANGSKAQVIYTDIDPDATLINDQFPIDFDGDGTTDITFFHQGIVLDDISVNFAYFDGEVIGSILNTYYVYGDVLLFGDPIGPGNANWQNSPQYYGYLGAVRTYYGDVYPDGEWLGQTGYLGVRFVGQDGLSRYAWVHLSMPEDATSVTLLGYAFESAPNTAITAGNIGNVGLSPEPKAIMGMNVFPNPVSDMARVEVSVEIPGSYEMRLCDPLGRTVMERRITLTTGVQQLDLDMQAMAIGSYVLELRNGKNVLQRKLIKH